jgi:hypothetical protein
MYIKKTKQGLSLVNKSSNAEVCGHLYPNIKGALIQCRKEIKNLFSSKEPITFESLNKIMDQSNTTHIRLPFDPEFMKMMITSKDPTIMAIKHALENDRRTLQDFLISCNSFINDNQVELSNLIIKQFNLIKDDNDNNQDPKYQHELRVLSFMPYPEPTPYHFYEGHTLFMACKKNKLITDVYLDRLVHFLNHQTTMRVLFHAHMGTPSDIVLLIEDLILQKKTIWLTAGYEILEGEGSHVNAVLMECTDDEIFITVVDPHLYSGPALDLVTVLEDKDARSQSMMMNELTKFIQIMSGKKVTTKRKIIQELCEIQYGLQSCDRFRSGICETYCVFIGAIYLMNKKNTTIKGRYINEDDDVTCFLALLKEQASKLVAIFFLMVFFKYKDMRDGICGNFFDTQCLSDHGINTQKRLYLFEVLKCHLNGEPEPLPLEEEEDYSDEMDDESMELQ